MAKRKFLVYLNIQTSVEVEAEGIEDVDDEVRNLSMDQLLEYVDGISIENVEPA